MLRDGKGGKDRVTVLPDSVKSPLQLYLREVRQLHQRDLESGGGRVHLPYALARKYPRADQEWGWQYVFPAPDLSRDPRTGKIARHHLHERALQRAFKAAVRSAGIVKPATVHTLRHYAELGIIVTASPPICRLRSPASREDGESVYQLVTGKDPTLCAECGHGHLRRVRKLPALARRPPP